MFLHKQTGNKPFSDLQVKSKELATEFLQRFSAHTHSQQQQILRNIQARGGAAGCSRQQAGGRRQEVMYYIRCRDHDNTQCWLPRLCLLRVCYCFFTGRYLFIFAVNIAGNLYCRTREKISQIDNEIAQEDWESDKCLYLYRMSVHNSEHRI